MTAPDTTGGNGPPQQLRQLRLAPVMTGGTSLAVWMGGVTTEMYALVRSNVEDLDQVPDTLRIYDRLLRATKTEPVVDVVTGTSAGGLNGTLLALAVHLHLPFDEFQDVRRTWMEHGDLAKLLRKPGQSDPPSLLRGDDYFKVEIKKVLDGWTEHARQSEGATATEPDCDVDLMTTYTRVNPLPVARTDDFDEALNEVSYAGTLRFTHAQLGDADDPETDHDPEINEKLAIAARTSAGIPGVFEPSFLPSFLEEEENRFNFARHQPPEVQGQSRWAVDGGVVVNLPLRYVIDRIFGQKSGGRVRRVVVYVSPTPADAVKRSGDKPSDPPKIAKSAATIVNAPRAEGIAGDVDAIRRSNRAVEQQRLARRTIGRLLSDPDTGDVVGALYDSYKVTRSQASVQQVTAMLLRRFPDDPRFDERQFDKVLRSQRSELLPKRVDQFEGGRQVWGWGIATIEQAASIVLGLINQALEIHARYRPEAVSENVRKAATLAERKLEVHDALDTVKKFRQLDDEFWVKLITSIDHECPTEAERRTDREERYRAAYAEWPYVGGSADLAAKRSKVFVELRAAHQRIAQVLLVAAGEMRQIVTPPPDPPDPTDPPVPTDPTDPTDPTVPTDPPDPPDPTVPTDPTDVAASRADFLAELRACLPPTDSDSVEVKTNVEAVERQLLRFHVLATLTIGGLTSREQPVELMQVSSNAPNLLDPDRCPADKLVGPELGRMGAFLKESWRANDWLWGRMDGAARLCRLLVDPQRIWELYGKGHCERERAFDAFGVTEESVGAEAFARIAHELTHLLESDDPQLFELPHLTAAMTKQLQLAIAREELPRVKEAIENSEAAGGNESGSRKFVQATEAAGWQNSDDEVARVLKKMKIGSETAGSELGSRLMVRNLTRTVTVAINAITGAESGLPALGLPFRVLRAPLRLLSAVIGALTGASPLARGLTAMILAGAGAVVAMRLAGVEVSGVLSGAAATLFVAALVVALVRLGVWRFAAMFALLAIPFTLALVGDDLRTVLYDKFEVTRVEIGPAVTVTFGAEVTLEVHDPSLPPLNCEPEPSEDEPNRESPAEPDACGFVAGGSAALTVEAEALAELLVRATSVSTGTEQIEPGWKAIFLADWGLAPLTWLVGAVAFVWAISSLARWWKQKSKAHAIRLIPAALLAALAVVNHLFAEAIFTGTETKPTEWERGLIDAAEWFGDQRLAVLLIVLVAVGTIIGVTSSALSRFLRKT